MIGEQRVHLIQLFIHCIYRLITEWVLKTKSKFLKRDIEKDTITVINKSDASFRRDVLERDSSYRVLRCHLNSDRIRKHGFSVCVVTKQ